MVYELADMFDLYQQPSADLAHSQNAVKKMPTLRDVANPSGLGTMPMEIMHVTR